MQITSSGRFSRYDAVEGVGSSSENDIDTLTCLGGEVSMEESLRVKVSHSLGGVAGDFHSHMPRYLLVAEYQLFQAATLDVLLWPLEKEKK